MNKTITIGVSFLAAGLLIGFGIGWLAYNRNEMAQVSEEEQTGEELKNVGEAEDGKEEGEMIEKEEITLPSATPMPSPPPASSGANTVTVKDQTAGDRVEIDSVIFAQPGWLVVHEDRNGAPGNILGAQWFGAGTYQGKAVDLLRSTVSGRTYYAMFHADAGDDHQFDHKKDLPIGDSAGNPIMTKFSIAQ
ncbi:MAG: hypothetical protein G01um101466_851 [Parcubacteria group bacterium Gr01-1014_66]|nr:MAG: hypothetical protein G01um101466_851 [Parcubacteria group bacterium Gr01-1014_66]